MVSTIYAFFFFCKVREIRHTHTESVNEKKWPFAYFHHQRGYQFVGFLQGNFIHHCPRLYFRIQKKVTIALLVALMYKL